MTDLLQTIADILTEQHNKRTVGSGRSFEDNAREVLEAVRVSGQTIPEPPPAAARKIADGSHIKRRRGR